MTKTFNVYQAALTDAQADELNGPNGGWDSKPEFSAYADITMGTMGGRDADEVVKAAAEAELFYHTAVITADDLEGVFFIGNGMAGEENIDRTNIFPMSSVSVGNVVINMDTNEAFFCDSFGWKPLDEMTRRVLLSTTVTRMSIGEAA